MTGCVRNCRLQGACRFGLLRSDNRQAIEDVRPAPSRVAVFWFSAAIPTRSTVIQGSERAIGYGNASTHSGKTGKLLDRSKIEPNSANTAANRTYVAK